MVRLSLPNSDTHRAIVAMAGCRQASAAPPDHLAASRIVMESRSASPDLSNFSSRRCAEPHTAIKLVCATSSVLRAKMHVETHRHFCTTPDRFGSAGRAASGEMLALLGRCIEPDHSGIARFVLRRFPVLRS